MKRSFFERLTGSTRHDLDVEEDEDVEEQEVDTTYDDSEEEYVEEDEADEETEEVEEEQERKVPAPPEEHQEGQLTVDVYQTPEHIVIKSTIAGVKPDNLDVSITNDMVTIRGTRRHDEEITDDDYFYRECYWGSFSRSIILPVDIVAEKADASLKDGILTIKIQKADALLTKKVKVRGF